MQNFHFGIAIALLHQTRRVLSVEDQAVAFIETRLLIVFMCCATEHESPSNNAFGVTSITGTVQGQEIFPSSLRTNIGFSGFSQSRLDFRLCILTVLYS